MTSSPIIPILVTILAIVVLILFTHWTDSKGWTRFRGNGRAAIGSAFDVLDQALNAERKAAIEYQINENAGLHGEQEAKGDDKSGRHQTLDTPEVAPSTDSAGKS